MSREHRRPLVAFVVVSILCAAMLGHGIRTDALVGLLGPRVSSSAAQNEPTVTVRDAAPSVAPTSPATGLPGLSAERVVTAAPSPSPSPSPTSAPTRTATAVVQPAAQATVVPIPVVTPTPTSTPTPTPTPPPTAVTSEVVDQGAQHDVVAARKAADEVAKQAEKARDAAARAAAKAVKHGLGLVPSALPTAVPAP